MGSFLFQWEHPASEVYVTGTFDDWGKTIKLDKKGTVHEKLVPLKESPDRILYKFVVDGNWTTDHTKKTETDSSGNTNNVLDPHDITGAAISNTAGNTTTQALAGQVPKEGNAAVSNTADNQTTQAMAGQVPKEGAAGGVPGAFPETPGDSEVKVNPIPATAGAGNPIQLKAGEAVPKSTGNVTDAVTTDKASYDKGGAPQLPSVVTPESERTGGFFGLGSDTKNLIPESSLPIVGGASTNLINSAGTGSTTAQLAGEVPVESRGVPEVVKESQEKAHASPEASANPEAVKEKSEVEKELEKKVPEEPAATESTMGGKAAATIGAAAASVSAAAAGAAAYMTSGKAKDDAKANLPESTDGAIDKVAPDGSAQTASTVPEVVQESIKDAHEKPEAAGNKEAVAEKAEVESELLQKVKHEDAAGEPAPTASAAVATEAPKATTDETGTPAVATAAATTATTTKSTPATAAATTTTTDKKDDSVRDSARPTETKPAGAGAMAQALQEQSADSRDVSPMTRADGTHATEHVGGSSGKGGLSKLKDKMAAAPSPSASSNPKSPTGSAGAAGSPKDKRSSGFFRKLKEKFDHHDKDGKKK